MSNVWFFGDSHFFHKNLVRGCSDWPDKEKACRDFNTVEEHNEYILNQLNKKIKSTDIAYCGGDFGLGFGFKDKFKEIRSKINCETIYLCRGNHDSIFQERNREKYKDLFAMFKEVRDIYQKKICGHFMVIFHYAMRTWIHQHHMAYHIYHHSHGNLPDDPNSLSMDCGLDSCLFGHEKYTPYSFDEIDHIMKNCKNKPVFLDHHQPDTTHDKQEMI